jgi:DNA-binding transcriptional ArsR family regulator
MHTEHTLKDFDALSQVCKALSHPARLAILNTLADRGACICGEIVDFLPLSQATVSQHLKVLKQAGLITGEVDGPKSCYCINSAAMSGIRRRFEQLFGSLEACCK